MTINAGNFSTIAEIGQPATGFPSDFIYWKLNTPTIGKNGHIAFTGIVDVNSQSTKQNQNAVWAGKLNNLQVVIKEGSPVKGFQSSTVFEEAGKDLIVSSSGSVAFKAKMTGSYNGLAYLASVNGTTSGVAYRGMPAPGFSKGTFIFELYDFLFTDAGMIIFGVTNTSQAAIWLWDNKTLKLVIAGAGPKGTKVSNNIITNFDNECTGSVVLSPSMLDFNQSGEILFFAGVESKEENCSRIGLFTWKKGIFKNIVEVKFKKQTTDEDYFLNIGLGTGMGSRINDNGNISFLAGSKNFPTSFGIQAGDAWIADNTGRLKPVAFRTEFLPGTSDKISYISSVSSNINGHSVITQSSRKEVIWILAGSSKQETGYLRTGESNLTLLAMIGSHPPNFSATSYFSSLRSPIINNQNNIIFTATVKNALDKDSSTGIWLGNSNGDLRLLLTPGQEVEVNGKNQVFGSIYRAESFASTTNSSRPTQFSDNNELVFSGSLEGKKSYAIFYYGEEVIHREEAVDCVASYDANGLLNIPCVTVPNGSGGTTVYQAKMNLISSNPFSFKLIEAQPRTERSIIHNCIATYKTDGSLDIPCVTVPNASGKIIEYQANMKLIPRSNPITFKLNQSQRKN